MSINISESKSESIEVLRPSGDSLITACRIGDMEDVVNILEDGGDINYQDIYGRTPLLFACRYGREEIVNYLLYKGASLTSMKTGQTPLHEATLVNENKIVHILLQHIEVNNKGYINLINNKTSDGLTALHIAAKKGNLEIVKTLLMYGAIYNIEDATRKTPKYFTKNEEIKKILELVEDLFHVHNGNIAVINKVKEFSDDTYYALVNACNERGNRLYMYDLNDRNKFIYDLVHLIPALKIDHLEYLKKASYHLLMSIIQVSMEGNWCTVEYFKKVYELVNQYKSRVPGKINNTEIASLNNILIGLAYDPRFVTADNADSFMSQRQNVEYYNTYYSTIMGMRGWEQILKSVNKHVEEFYKLMKTELQALYLDNLVQFCEIGDSLGVEHLITRIRNESPDVSNNEMAPFFEVMYWVRPYTVMTLETSEGFTPLHIAAENGHLEVIKTLLRHGAVYNSGYYEGVTPKSLSKNQDVIDFLSLVDSIFGDVKKGDINVLNKLTALEKDGFLAVTSARNIQVNSLLQVAVKNRHYKIARSLKTLMETFEKN